MSQNLFHNPVFFEKISTYLWCDKTCKISMFYQHLESSWTEFLYKFAKKTIFETARLDRDETSRDGSWLVSKLVSSWNRSRPKLLSRLVSNARLDETSRDCLVSWEALPGVTWTHTHGMLKKSSRFKKVIQSLVIFKVSHLSVILATCKKLKWGPIRIKSCKQSQFM